MSESDLDLYAKQRLGMVLRGKYRLDSVLGVGGMAAVYKATHRNQAEFAVKMLHPGLSIREDVRTRFLREGYAANSVKHPGAVLVVDDDTAEDGAAFLVMELLDGEGVEALWERMKGRVPVLMAASIVVQLLDVLAAAHAKGIVHRDIKPANLFITRDGALKVLDFGIARARDAIAGSAGHTGTGILLGTPAFMPPEQAMAKSTEIDSQTDLWAAGATFFTLVSGHLVHEGDNAAQLMIRAATVPARAMASMMPDVPPAVARVIDCSLAFEKSARWPNATAMRDALIEACRATFGEAPSRASLTPQQRSSRDVALAATAYAAPEPRSPMGSAPGPTTPWSQAGSARIPSSPRLSPAEPIGQRQLVGGTTAQPTSNTRASSEPPAGVPKRAGMALGIGAALVLLAGGGAALFVSSRGGPPPIGSGGLVFSAEPSTAATQAVPPASSGSNVDHAGPSPDVPSPLAASVTPALAAPSVAPPSHRPAPAPVRAAPSKPAAPPAAAKPKPNCDPNFTLDADGNKHFKPECF